MITASTSCRSRSAKVQRLRHGFGDAVDAGHVEVHHDDVGRELAHRPERVGAVVALACHVHPLLLEQVAQPGPEQVVIVHEQDSRRDGLGDVCWVAQIGLPGPTSLPGTVANEA